MEPGEGLSKKVPPGWADTMSPALRDYMHKAGYMASDMTGIGVSPQDVGEGDAIQPATSPLEAAVSSVGSRLGAPAASALEEFGGSLAAHNAALGESGQIVIPGLNYLKATKGTNPFSLTPKAFGKDLAENTGRFNMFGKTTSLLGEHAKDVYPGATDEALLKSLAKDYGVEPPAGKLYLDYTRNSPIGSYSQALQDTMVNPTRILDQDMMDPETYKKGLLLHEGMHHVDQMKRSPHDFNLYSGEIDLDPTRVPLNSEVNNYLSDSTKRGAVWDYLTANGPKGGEEFNKMMSNPGQYVRTALGNRGFSGTDPGLISTISNAGHFSGPWQNLGEMYQAPYEMARKQITEGGAEIPDSWRHLFGDTNVRRMEDAYKMPTWNKITNQSPAGEIMTQGMPPVEGRNLPPWIPFGVGGGAAAAGAYYGVKKGMDSK